MKNTLSFVFSEYYSWMFKIIEKVKSCRKIAERMLALSRTLLCIGVRGAIVACVSTTPLMAKQLSADVHRISPYGIHEKIGQIKLEQTDDYLNMIVHLSNFPPGWHATHVHNNGSCEPGESDGKLVAGFGAGAHFDPTGVMKMRMSKKQKASEANHSKMMQMDVESDNLSDTVSYETRPEEAIPPGRLPRPLGDLPAIYTDSHGKTAATGWRLTTNKLSLNQLVGRSLIIHAHEEGSSDPFLPQDGGPRIACSVISKSGSPAESK